MMKWFCLSLFLFPYGQAGLKAESLEMAEHISLEQYLEALEARQPGLARKVDELADISFDGFKTIMKAYVELEEPIERATHLAFHDLLDRASRSALAPWPLLQIYSKDFTHFLTGPVKRNALAQRLFDRLMKSNLPLRPFDLAVKLSPEAALRHLAEQKQPGRIELLDAWNRRLSRSREQRPIHVLGQLVTAIAASFSEELNEREMQSHLLFVASWRSQHPLYRKLLNRCLNSKSAAVVRSGLRVQERFPERLDLNEGLVDRFIADPKILQQAIHNYAFDSSADHSKTLRRIWERLKPKQAKARYECLFSMGIHSNGNADVALTAVHQNPFDFIDVASPVLEKGESGPALEAIRHVLKNSKRGREEALRLANKLGLKEFASQAVRIAGDANAEQILRQTALIYLGLTDGKSRRQLLSFLAHPNEDIRLAAIQMFHSKSGLSESDMDEIGPALIRVATADPSMGHRQEAIYALGNWKVMMAKKFFKKMLADNPPINLQAGAYKDKGYWRYRFRLVGLLGLAKLGDAAATSELLELHRRGGTSERMDVLLAFIDLEEAPPAAFEDLNATEPKLIATAARLIRDHGSVQQKQRMKKKFLEAPLWKQFTESGIDDHNILRYAGVKDE